MKIIFIDSPLMKSSYQTFESPRDKPGSGLIGSSLESNTNIVKLRQGSGKDRQGKARMAKGERP